MAAPGPPVAGTFAAAQSGTVSPTLPAGIVADEVVIVCALSHNPNGPTTALGWPAGYTEIFQDDVFDSGGTKLGRAGAAWHRATGAESGTINVTRDGDTGTDTLFPCMVWRVTGCKTTGNPYDVVQRNSPNPGGSATLDFPSITTLVADALIMSIGMVGGSNTSYGTPASWTTGSSNGSNSGTDGTIDMDYRAPGATGSYDPASPTITVDADTAWETFQISLIPPGTATDYTDSQTVAVALVPSGGDGLEHVDSGTEPFKLTPSGTDTLTLPGITDAATVVLALVPSGAELRHDYPLPGTLRGLMAMYVSELPEAIDAATVTIKFTPSSVDVAALSTVGSVYFDLAPSGDEFTNQAPPPTVPQITTFDFEPPSDGFIDWKLIHLNNQLQAIGEVTPYGLEWAIYHDRAGYVNYEINQDHRLCDPVFTKPKVTFFELYRGNLKLLAGPHSEVDSVLGETSIKVAGQSWEWYFENRFWPFNPDNIDQYAFTKAGVDIYLIVDEMLDTILAQPYSIPFTYSFGTLGSTMNFKIELGDTENFMEKLNTIREREPGFDMRISPDREITLHSPRIDVASGYRLEQGTNVLEMDYRNSGHQGTELLGYAQTPEGKVGYKINDLLNIPDRRLWEHRIDYGQLASKTELIAKMTRDFEHMRVPLRELSVKVQPREFENIWSEVKPGYTVWCQGETPYEPVDGEFRCIGMQGVVTEGGSEEITITFDDDTLEF